VRRPVAWVVAVDSPPQAEEPADAAPGGGTDDGGTGDGGAADGGKAGDEGDHEGVGEGSPVTTPVAPTTP
jgi:hypothetical protein